MKAVERSFRPVFAIKNSTFPSKNDRKTPNIF